jgi:rhomboid protease GluP
MLSLLPKPAEIEFLYPDKMPDSTASRCTRCGRELASSYWNSSGLCPSCVAGQAPMTGTVLSPDTPVPPPANRARVVRPPLISVTSVLVGLNVLVFVAMVFSNVPIMGGTIDQLLRWGANWGPYSLGAQPWRILTSNYLHIGIIHIFFNMWCLWNLGFLVERILDRWTYVLAYTACGIGGSLASLSWHPMVYGAGASGAIFGLAGLMITIFYLGNLPIPKSAIKPTLKSLISFAVYNLLFGLVPGIDNSAHIGGLVTGLALGAVLAKTVTAPRETRAASRWLIFGATAAVLAGGMVLVQRQHSDVQALGRGLNALHFGDYEKALTDLNYAQKNTRSQQVQFILGQAYLQAHHPDEAITAFQNVLKSTPDAEVERALAEAYQAKGMQREADEALSKAQELEHQK